MRFQIDSERGLKINGCQFIDETKVNQPAAIILHGFSGSQFETHIMKLAIDLYNIGFATFTFDTIGYGISEGKPENDYRLSNYYSDLERVYTHVKNNDLINPEKISLIGHSCGAMLALIFSARVKSIYSTIAIQPVHSYYREGKDELYKNGYYIKKEAKEHPNNLLKLPIEFLEDSKKFNVLSEAEKIQSKVLLISGSLDENATPQIVNNIATKLTCEKQLVQIENITHFYKDKLSSINLVNEEVLKFLK